MEIPKHPIEEFVESGDAAVLESLTKSELIATLNIVTGFSRVDEDGSELGVHEYNNTIQKNELREAIVQIKEAVNEDEDEESN
jgi:hypothetical protein